MQHFKNCKTIIYKCFIGESKSLDLLNMQQISSYYDITF